MIAIPYLRDLTKRAALHQFTVKPMVTALLKTKVSTKVNIGKLVA